MSQRRERAARTACSPAAAVEMMGSPSASEAVAPSSVGFDQRPLKLRRRWPSAADLPHQDDASEMIGVVGGQALELLANGHRSHWRAGRTRAADYAVEYFRITRGGSRSFNSGQESMAEVTPAFLLNLRRAGESQSR